VPFSILYAILGHESLRLESKDSLYDFIKKGVETNGEMFNLLEFARLKYCSMTVTGDLCDLLSVHFYEINASIWTGLRAQLVLINRTRKQFPPLVKKVMAKSALSGQSGKEIKIDMPDGIIAHLTRECSGNIHDRHVVDITSGRSRRRFAVPIETRGL
jgi:hypothetical protein